MEWSFKKYVCIVTFIYITVFLLSATILPLIFGNIHDVITADQLRINSINITQSSALVKLLIGNILISAIIILSGVFGSEIIPILILTWNAFYFGEIISALNKPDTFGMMYSLFPHGIIEIPAAILCTIFACNYALKMREVSGNKSMWKVIMYEGSISHILRKYVVKPYIYYVLPLIIMGCIVESTISLYIMRAIFNGS